ncbi:hypothetical protein F5144DRAFT_74205 [Chaetomium tenue]|uniref:Uncharacterized protein n=1 Tax=Chaetomium tenue TaxID=1854479 RepID=A0ACB7PRT2_9PEZI|nr:hypothetical protein F5144DRAFT_74205 [Chaetomium globosum]
MDLIAPNVVKCRSGELYVSPTAFVQTAENRFGPGVLQDLNTFVHGTPEELLGPIDEEPVNDEEDGDELYDQAVNEWAPHLDIGLETHHAEHGFPRIAALRNNLTALSQRYNLYFAAYQDRIYVYQPRRTSPQILPPPTLILHPQPSKWARRWPQGLDHRFPHQVNHIIVGNLGDFEIVLLAYDNGDTLAYYTHSIAHHITQSSNHTRSPSVSSASKRSYPKPFFHDNVGESAWGLAVHEKSRLIAVSSNLREVTVFAFALAQRNGSSLRRTERRPIPVHSLLEVQKDFLSRSREWRIVLPLDAEGFNIPNLSFTEDEMGDAEKVVARDLSGALWFLDIWRLGVPHVRWHDSYGRSGVPYVQKGWGVLVLPYSSFRPTKSSRETLGIPRNQVVIIRRENRQHRISMDAHYSTCLDITCSLYFTKGFWPSAGTLHELGHAPFNYASKHMLHIHGASQEDEEDEIEDESESEPDAEGSAQTTSEHTTITVPNRDLNITKVGHCNSRLEESHRKGAPGFQVAGCIIPNSCELLILDDGPDQRVEFARVCKARKRDINVIEYATAEDLPRHLTKTHGLFSAYTGDVAFQPFDLASPYIQFRFLLTEQCHPNASAQSWDLHPMHAERVSMLHHVPELSLVVAGSPTGRVALLTPTKGPRCPGMGNLRYGFRVDYILPRKFEKDASVARLSRDRPSVQPLCALIGVAIGPAPRGPGLKLRPPDRDASGNAVPGTYRLMLHYKDHAILMYDIRRDQEELLVL